MRRITDWGLLGSPFAPMPEQIDDTPDLLRRWHGGDRQALGVLLDRDRGWIRSAVRRQRGERLKRFDDTVDDMQDLMVEVLEYAPRFEVANQRQFRGLVSRMIRNLLIDKARKIKVRQPRGLAQGDALGESRISLDPALASMTSPSEAAAREEELQWLRIGIEFLDDEDRDVIRMHKFEGIPFAEIARRFEVEANTARMRCRRALLRLAGIVQRLQRDGIDSILDSAALPPNDDATGHAP